MSILFSLSRRCSSALLPPAARLAFSVRGMSTRQAERLRRQSGAASSTAPSSTAGGATSAGHPHAARTMNKFTSSAAQRGKAGAKKAAPSSPVRPPASSGGASKPAMRGRFNRLVVERGFFFTVYLYVLGESMTMFLTYLLHSHRLGVGDVGSWLEAVRFPTDRLLNVGPTIYGLQCTPRLLLNYLVASACTYPLLPYQMRFCAATAPLLKAPFVLLGKAFKKAEPVVPKAPPVQP